MSGILSFLGGPITSLVKEVGGVIDSLSTTKEEKLDAQRKLIALQQAFQSKVMEVDAIFAAERAKVIMAEATSESWLTRNWRPILMLVFTYIIAHNFVIAPMFSVPRVEIPDNMWELLKLGMGGYIFGRSAEYVAEQAADAIKTKKQS
jgi:hypothetical protein